MKKRILYISWAVMFALCAGLGFVLPEAQEQKVALTALSFLFFLPPGWLALDAFRSKDKKTFRILSYMSGGSLLLTTAAYIANLASVAASETVGNVLYGVLVVVSVPMVSMGVELLSLFLWACLFIFSLQNRK